MRVWPLVWTQDHVGEEIVLYGKEPLQLPKQSTSQVSPAVLVGDRALCPEPAGWLALTQPRAQPAELCHCQALTPERRGRLAAASGEPWPDPPPVRIGCAPTYLAWGRPRFPTSGAVQAAQLACLVPAWKRHLAKTCIQSQETENRPSAASKRGLQSSGTEIFPVLVSPVIHFFPKVSIILCVLVVLFFWFHLKEDFTSPQNKLYLHHKRVRETLLCRRSFQKKRGKKPREQ